MIVCQVAGLLEGWWQIVTLLPYCAIADDAPPTAAMSCAWLDPLPPVETVAELPLTTFVTAVVPSAAADAAYPTPPVTARATTSARVSATAVTRRRLWRLRIR